MKSLFTSAIASGLMSLSASAASTSLGKTIYEQPGANSCLYCHGVDGKRGNIAGAANLSQPKTWKSYKALGGDAALIKNRAEFLSHFDDAVTALIVKGAVVHNMTYKKPFFDWKKISPFNPMMLGMTAGPSLAWVEQSKAKGMTKEVAGNAVYLYIQQFDQQHVFKK